MGRLQELYNQHLKDPKPTDKDGRVLIVDGLNMYIRIWAAVPALNDEGQHVGGVVGFLKSLGALIRQFNPSRCIVVFDGKGGSLRRKKLYPDYKANRSTKIQLNRFEDFEGLEDEQKSMKAQFGRLIEYLNDLPLSVFAMDHIEADDAMAYIVTDYYANSDNQIIIASTDRDFLQLINERVTVWSPVKKKLYDEKLLFKEIGIPSYNYLTYRTIIGDPSDNIQGVKGIGLKTLLKHFPEIKTQLVDASELIRLSRERLKEGKNRIATLVINNADILERNYKLMQLATANISADASLKITEHVSKPYGKVDDYSFKRKFAADQLYSNIPNVESWLMSTFNGINLYGELK